MQRGSLGEAGHGGTDLHSLQLTPSAGMGPLLLALASCLGLAVASEGAADGSRLCREAPAWRINGSSPMEGTAGQVTVVALLKAS